MAKDQRASFFSALLRMALGNEPELESEWLISCAPTAARSAIAADGFMSQGNDEHVAPLYRRRWQVLDDTERLASLAGVSYVRPCFAYSWEDTLRGIEAHARRVVDLLVNLRDEQEVVLIGYSMGGAAVLLAMAELLDAGSPLFESNVKGIVLLQPAIFGCQDLTEAIPAMRNLLVQRRGYDTLGDELPAIVVDLEAENAPYPTRARNTIPRLLDAGVSIDVIYTENDLIAEYRLQRDARMRERRVSAEELRFSTDGPSTHRHTRLRNEHATSTILHSILRDEVDWADPTPV